jgi:WD40 repeat protein
VDWELWKRDLPEQQFADEQTRFKWSARTPPGQIAVTCSLERYGSAFNREYKNQVTYDYHGDLNTLSNNYETSVFASKGFLAPSISSSSNKIICGGLNGVVSIWDLPSGSLESTLYVGTKTIVAIAGFPDLKRCAALTLDGRLLIIDPMVNSERKGKLAAFPKDLYLSKNHPIAIVTYVDGAIRIRNTETHISYSRRPNWQAGSPFATFRLTPDLSVAIITGHGEDYYDGWLLNGINLVTGKELFAFETKMSNDTFGEFTLEDHDGKLYLRHDPRNMKTSSHFALSSFTDQVTWICLASGVEQHVPPTKNGKKINWARPSFIRGKVVASEYAPWFKDGSTDEDTVYDGIQLSSNLRTIIAGRSNQQKAQFTMDDEIFLLGISPFDDAVVCVIGSIYLLDLVQKN